MEQHDLARKIREILPAETYGLKHYLLGDLHRDGAGNVWMHHDRTNITNGWECGDSALKIQKLLRDEGIESAICRGVSEDTIMKVHLFVRDKAGRIYDGVPLYPTIGAKHQVQEVYSPDEVTRYFGANKIYVHTGMPPVELCEENGALYLLAASVGLTYLITPPFPQPNCSATLFAVKKWGTAFSCHELHAKIDVKTYHKQRLSPLQQYAPDAMKERLHELRAKGCLGIWAATIKPSLAGIPQDVTAHLEDNVNVLLSLLEKQAAQA